MLDQDEKNLNSKIGHKRVKTKDTTTYIIYGVLKLANNPKRTRWSLIKSRIEKALKKEFGEDLVW